MDYSPTMHCHTVDLTVERRSNAGCRCTCTGCVQGSGIYATVPDFVFQSSSVFVQVDKGDHVSWRPIPANLLYFSQSTGMSMVQLNGQRIYGPPKNYAGSTPPRGCEVFVGALPRDCDELDLVPIFGNVGKIYQIRLMMDFSGTNRGFCFVQYFTIQEATKAIQQIHKFQIRPGRAIGVFRSVDNCRLKLTGVSKTLKAQDIFTELITKFEGILYVTVANRPVNRQTLQNTALIEFDSHRSAAVARRALIPKGFVMNGHHINVEWAKPVRTH